MVLSTLSPSSLSSTLTATHTSKDMSQWMTSGASRLRSKQNRSFAARAKASAASSTSAIRSTSRFPTKRHGGGRRMRMAAGETITSRPSKSLYRTGASSSMNHAVPSTVTSHTFSSMDEHANHVPPRRNNKTLLPLSVMGGAMPASRNPFLSAGTHTRPANDNPFEAAMQAVEETRSRAEMSLTGPFRSQLSQHSSPLTAASLSLKGDKILRLLAANQNGSVASPSSFSQMSRMTTSKNPFALPERSVSRNQQGLQLPPRGIKLPPRRMAMEQESNEFVFDTPAAVDVPTSLCIRQTCNGFAVMERSPSRGLKRGNSDDSSFSDDSSTYGSRKQARRLNALSVSEKRNSMSRGAGGFDRFRNRRLSEESHQSNPVVSSQPVPSVINTLPNRSKNAPPLRFFNNGVEVDYNGNPLPIAPEPEPEPVDLDTLKDHQQSVWEQFTETPEEVEARKKKKKKTRRKTKSPSIGEEQASADPHKLKIDPTPSALSADPTKLASADVDDLVRDSLKEREKTLSAASVLMGFLGGNSLDKQKASSTIQSAQM